ncbi:calcium-binding protein [Yoonia sp. R2331]|uniref:calcium-binding protein n=1 Tax=Yoonia sp. R2331 TaxID=3237238 RepID=UPI0034E4E78F
MAISRIDQIGGVAGQVLLVESVQVGGRTYVYTETNSEIDGIGLYRLRNSGDLQYIGQELAIGDLPDFYYFRPEDLARPSGFGSYTDFFGQLTLVTYGRFDSLTEDTVDDGLQFFAIASDGTLSLSGVVPRDPGLDVTLEGYVPDAFDDGIFFQIVDMGGNTNDQLIFSVIDSATSLDTYSYTLQSSIADTAFAVDDDSRSLMFYVDDDGGQIRWVNVSPFTGSGQTGVLDGSGGLSADKVAADLEVLRMGGDDFVISVSEKDGLRAFEYTNFVSSVGLDGLFGKLSSQNGTKNWSTDIIETFSIGDRGFVVAGGDKLTVFELDDDGRFFNMNRKGNFDGSINDIDVVVRKGNGVITVATDDGVETFVFTPEQARDVNGTNSRDVISGDSRNNDFDGNGGNDILRGGRGNDSLSGDAGFDSLYGADGNDEIFGGDGNDFVSGGSGNDFVSGGDGFDKINGGSGNDRLFGGNTGDIIYGGSDNDLVAGGNGNDRLFDGKGVDVLVGGAGSDVFVMAQDGQVDTIRTWETRDRIDLRAFGKDLDFQDLDIRQRPDGNLNIFIEGEILVLDANNRLTVGSLQQDDFSFA